MAADNAEHASSPSERATVSRSTTIRIATIDDRAGWDHFVDGNPAGTFFHRYAWNNVLYSAFGYEPVFLIAERAGAVVGVLPLVHKKSVLFGSTLVSLPFCSYGGPLGASTQITASLTDHALDLAQGLGTDVIELRGGTPSEDTWTRRSQAYATFEKTIAGTPEAIIATIPRKGRRHALRQSLRAGLSFEPESHLNEFYSVMAESYRNLGTPIFPRRYFEILKSEFADAVDVWIVRRGRTRLATALTFSFGASLHPLYAGGTASARACGANDFLFFNLMCVALHKGLTRFDFGRSKFGTGSFAYKRFWGFKPRPLTYGYRLVHGKRLPFLSPANPRYRPLVGAWKHLPLGVSRVLGPPLVRHLG